MTTIYDAKQSLAIKLKNARKSKRISLPKMAKLMHVPESTIEAIEDQEKVDIPLANLVGLVNRYIEIVGLNSSEIAEELAVLTPKPQTDGRVKVKKQGSRMFVASRATLALIATLALSIIIGYAVWQAWQLTAAPKLELYQPAGKVILSTEPSVKVEGKSSPDSSVLVNGTNVTLAEDGSFSTTYYLQPGQNFLQVRALNALGHEAVKDVIIHYKTAE